MGIREAKAQLSRLVQRVQGGDSVTLTYRGRPIARIVPITEPDNTPEAQIDELKRRGWIEDEIAAPVALPRLEVESELAQRFLREGRQAR